MEAELVNGLCQRYRALPTEGGVMDQPVWILRMQRILALGEGEERSQPEPELADLQMLLG